MTYNNEKLAKGRATLQKRAYAIKADGHPKQEDTLTGGYITIHGERRLVPLSVRKAKQRHCRSCSYFHRNNPCDKGYYVSPATDAEDCFRDRNWRKIG